MSTNIHKNIHNKTRSREAEKRNDKRTDRNQAIAFSLFNTRHRAMELPCRSCNESETGMCFETVQPLYPGMIVCILADQEVARRDSALAEVRWCQAKEAGHPTYQVGVRFC
jgi:hypothetical protein